MTRDFLEMCDSYLQHCKFQNQRKQAVYRCYLREKLDLRRKAESLIVENLENKLAKQSLQKLMGEQLQKAQNLKAELAEKRQESDKVQREIERRQRLKEEQTKRELELQRAKFERHAQAVKEQAEKFKTARQAEVRQALLEAEAKSREQQQQLKQLIEMKAPDVMRRQAGAEVQLVQKLEERKRKELQEEERRERIREAIESYRDRPAPERDVRRMRAETESHGIRRETKEAKPLFNNPGYFDDKLMSDKRFKLQTKLFEAGIVNNDYARAIFNHLSNHNSNQ